VHQESASRVYVGIELIELRKSIDQLIRNLFCLSNAPLFVFQSVAAWENALVDMKPVAPVSNS
jgi:hypothetical protein